MNVDSNWVHDSSVKSNREKALMLSKKRHQYEMGKEVHLTPHPESPRAYIVKYKDHAG
jgi:hypothetical protein